MRIRAISCSTWVVLGDQQTQQQHKVFIQRVDIDLTPPSMSKVYTTEQSNNMWRLTTPHRAPCCSLGEHWFYMAASSYMRCDVVYTTYTASQSVHLQYGCGRWLYRQFLMTTTQCANKKPASMQSVSLVYIQDSHEVGPQSGVKVTRTCAIDWACSIWGEMRAGLFGICRQYSCCEGYADAAARCLIWRSARQVLWTSLRVRSWVSPINRSI